MRLNRACAAGAGLAIATLASPSAADDATKRACVRANEEGQDLRRTGKLLEARARFDSCAVPKCPKVLRDDCVTRRDETQSVVPSVVLVVRSARGEQTPGIGITVDGRVPAQKGDEIELDPGEHTFEITAPAHATVTRRLTLQEGVKRREEVVALPDATASSDTTTTSRIAPRIGLAYGAAGVGIVLIGVGTYFVFAADSTYADAEAARLRCPAPPEPCNDDPNAIERRADNQATIAGVTIAMGALSLVGGLGLYLTSSSGRAITILPSFGRTVAGLGAQTSF